MNVTMLCVNNNGMVYIVWRMMIPYRPMSVYFDFWVLKGNRTTSLKLFNHHDFIYGLELHFILV